MMQAQCQPGVYTKRKQYYPASNISARISFSTTQNILNVGTIKRGPVQESFIRTDMKTFPKATASW